jgi:hypothetical protein
VEDWAGYFAVADAEGVYAVDGAGEPAFFAHEECFADGHDLFLEFVDSLGVVVVVCLPEVCVDLWFVVSAGGYAAFCAEGECPCDVGFVALEDDGVVACDGFNDVGEVFAVAGAFFEGVCPAFFEHGVDGGEGEDAVGAGGDVVDDHVHVGCVSAGVEVVEEFLFVGGGDVVGGGDDHVVEPDLVEDFDAGEGLFCGGCDDAAEECYGCGGFVFGDFHEALPFVVGEEGAEAAGAADEDAVDAAFDTVLDEGSDGGFVDAFVFVEGREEGNDYPLGDWAFIGHFFIPFLSCKVLGSTCVLVFMAVGAAVFFSMRLRGQRGMRRGTKGC